MPPDTAVTQAVSGRRASTRAMSRAPSGGTRSRTSHSARPVPRRSIIAEITAGRVRGVTRPDGVTAFLGLPYADAERFAEFAARGDVVVVTVNYRLGVLGFLRLPGLSLGNLGLLDQLAALRWCAITSPPSAATPPT